MKLKNETAKEMLYKLYAARIFEERVNEMFMRGMIHGTTHLSVGQEGVAVGSIYAVNSDDLIMSNHRGHSHCIAKDADVKKMMCELLGREYGFCKGMGGSMHIVDIASNNYGANGIIGPAIPIATGIALALKKDIEEKVILDFFGDGTSNTGSFHEALNMAALWKLPIVYICENRCWTAIEVLCYRVKKYIGAYAAAMGGVDAIVFAGGIGENDIPVRAKILEGLEFLGVRVDYDQNNEKGVQKVISMPESKVFVMVVLTNEELMIAKDTYIKCC